MATSDTSMSEEIRVSKGEQILLAVFRIFLPTLDIITDLVQVLLLALSGYPVASAILSGPFIFRFIVTLIVFISDQTNRLSLELVWLLLQVWPQFRTAQYIFGSYETKDAQERAKQAISSVTHIEPLLESIPQTIIGGYLVLIVKPCSANAAVFISSLVSLAVSIASALSGTVLSAGEFILIRAKWDMPWPQSLGPPVYVLTSLLWTWLFKVSTILSGDALTWVTNQTSACKRDGELSAFEDVDAFFPISNGVILWLGITFIPHAMLQVVLHRRHLKFVFQSGLFPIMFSYISFVTIGARPQDCHSPRPEFALVGLHINYWIHLLSSSLYLFIANGFPALYIVFPFWLFTTLGLGKFKVWTIVCAVGLIGCIIMVWNGQMGVLEKILQSVTLLLAFLLSMGIYGFESSPTEEVVQTGDHNPKPVNTSTSEHLEQDQASVSTTTTLGSEEPQMEIICVPKTFHKPKASAMEHHLAEGVVLQANSLTQGHSVPIDSKSEAQI